MKPVAFGKVPVAAAGTPVRLGKGVLSSGITSISTSLTLTPAGSFCADMAPFAVLIDTEQLEVSAYDPSTGVATLSARGINGTTPASHSSSAVVLALFEFQRLDAQPDDANTGKSYIGTSHISVSSKRGILKSFEIPAAGTSDDWEVCSAGNSLRLTDFWVDVVVSGEGVAVALWLE